MLFSKPPKLPETKGTLILDSISGFHAETQGTGGVLDASRQLKGGGTSPNVSPRTWNRNIFGKTCYNFPCYIVIPCVSHFLSSKIGGMGIC